METFQCGIKLSAIAENGRRRYRRPSALNPNPNDKTIKVHSSDKEGVKWFYFQISIAQHPDLVPRSKVLPIDQNHGNKNRIL